jgi:cellulose biosynthesis protein BcsQ
VSESVFEAADALLVPIIPATLSSRTLDQLETLVNGKPAVLAFFSMVDGRKRLHRDVMERLRTEHASVLGAAIPASAEVERMGLERTVLAGFAPRGRAARAYEALWADVRRRLGEYASPAS